MKWYINICLALLLALAAVSCGDDDDDNDDAGSNVSPTETERASGTPNTTFIPGESSRPADSTYVFTIASVGLGPDGYVELRNFSDVPASLKGLFLCQPPECFELPDVQVAGGESAFVGASEGTDVPDVAATWPEITLSPSDGEVGVYASEETDNPDAVRAYMQWGSTPHTGTETAVEAGFWVDGYAPTSPNATRLFQNEGGLWLFDE